MTTSLLPCLLCIEFVPKFAVPVVMLVNEKLVKFHNSKEWELLELILFPDSLKPPRSSLNRFECNRFMLMNNEREGELGG